MFHSYFMQTTRVEKRNKGRDLAYGMLIRNIEDYKYVKGFVESNQIAWSILDSQQWLSVKNMDAKEGYGKFYSSDSSNLFSASGHHFKYSMVAVCVMIALIVVFGVFYEMKRKEGFCHRCSATEPSCNDI